MNRNSLFRAFFFAVTFLSFFANYPAAPQPACTPGITYFSLLESVGIGYGDGKLRLDRLYGICLPTPAKASTSNYPYDPDLGGKLSTVVKSADGNVVNTYVWYAESIGGLWDMSRYKVVGGYPSIKPLGVGNYLLEFAIEDKPFYRFPFSVAETKADDPYQPAGSRYFIEGPWNEYGNIYFQRNDPKSVLKFTTWLQDKSGHVSKTTVPSEVKLISLKDGKVVGIARHNLLLKPAWSQVDFLLLSGGDQPNYLKAGDLLSQDGKYRVLVTLDGKAHGEYPFTVKEGRIQLQGRQLRENTSPMDLIIDHLSGGRYTSWWIKREKR